MKLKLLLVAFILNAAANAMHAQSVNTVDSLALVTLYQSTNGPTWTNNSQWLAGKVKNWYGVTVTNKRVTALNLKNNNLHGALPNEIGNLKKLLALNLSNNQLTGNVPASLGTLNYLVTCLLNNNRLENLPNLSIIITPIVINVAKNKLTFEDLVPNIVKLVKPAQYVPQDSVGPKETLNVSYGSEVTLSANYAGGLPSNRYQWFKGLTAISPITANPELVLSNVTDNEEGVYTCAITNTKVKGLTIYRRPITLNVTPVINIDLASGTQFCAGNAISLVFNLLGEFGSSEVFTAQLSEVNSSTFSTLIGSGASSPIIGVIPTSSTPGAYKLRVISAGGIVSDSVEVLINGPLDYTWVRKAGSDRVDEATTEWSYAIASDSQGNIHIVGGFTGTAIFGLDTLISNGPSDGYIAKYDPSGNILWVKQVGESKSDVDYDISIDPSGNIFIVGTYVAESSSGSFDILVAKYDASGSEIWTRNSGGTFGDVGGSISTDSLGNAYVTGTFLGTANFGSFTLSSVGSEDIFLLKYSSSGDVIWAKRAGGLYQDFAQDIKSDVEGNSYITGWFSGTAFFDNLNLVNAGVSYNDIFIVKYNSLGDAVWAKRAGGNNFDFGRGITLDPLGNVYVTGGFTGTANFDAIALTSAGAEDLFVAKYSPTGNVIWVKASGEGKYDSGRDVAIDINGNVYVAGWKKSDIIFIDGISGSDIYVGKYDAFGNKIKEIVTGGIGKDLARGIALDPSGDVYVTGNFEGEVNFGNIVRTSRGSSDLFIAKLSCAPSSDSSDIPVVSESSQMRLISEIERPMKAKAFPNPFLNEINLIFEGKENTEVELKITDGHGIIVGSVKKYKVNTLISLGNTLQPGLYIVKAVVGNKTENFKIIKSR